MVTQGEGPEALALGHRKGDHEHGDISVPEPWDLGNFPSELLRTGGSARIEMQNQTITRLTDQGRHCVSRLMS